jgi:7,8-dihydropterin-6-yl-methyl-4-(beta-D-ribofuranosyl)aminobenzene 5'-phosphate synthase
MTGTSLDNSIQRVREDKMSKEALQLKKADRVEVTILDDNYTDVFLASSERVIRPSHIMEGNLIRGLLADHGLSVMIDVFEGSNCYRLLFDTGQSDVVVPWNIESLGICLKDVEAVALGHGHHDHFGGLIRLYKEGLLPRSAPLHVHPGVFTQRYVSLKEGGCARMLQLTRKPLNHLGVEIRENTEPELLASGLALLTGEVERVTDFEPGFPPGRNMVDEQIIPDTMIMDEQALVLNVKDKGLVIISSCGHPGLINIILYAHKITGENRMYFVIGGFHLTGAIFEPIIPPTITEMKKLSPEMVVACHCTGWNAINAFSREMPEQFVLNAVGTKYLL